MNIASAFDEHQRVLTDSLAVLPAVLEQAAQMLIDTLRAGKKILVCGNGGSAADAQHFAAELLGRFETDRRALAVVALTGDTSTLTAIANDHGFVRVFARQVEALAQSGDTLLAISTSGQSPNVCAAGKSARAMGCKVIALTGRDGGALGKECDLPIRVPSNTVARIQEIHELCLHALAKEIEVATVQAGAADAS